MTNSGNSSSADRRPEGADWIPTVLIVDDEELSRETLKDACRSANKEQPLRILEASSLPWAFKALSENEVHVVLLDKHVGPDVNDPAQDGILAIPRFLSEQPHLQILMITASRSYQDAVQAMRNKAFGYIRKDEDPSLIIEQIKNAIRYARLAQRALWSRADEDARPRIGLVGSSACVSKMRNQINMLAGNSTPVLLSGETGTGKTTVARLIHEVRHRGHEKAPFIHINMAAVPAELAERLLFGTEKGAYTGATEARPGYLEMANGGTLFLDEIGEASLDLQSKLLTALDEKTFMRLGALQVRKSDFRLICATNRNLRDLVKQKKFREDLYHRITIVEIPIASLADRREDVPELIRSVLHKCCERSGVFVEYEQIPNDFIQHLVDFPPAGNIRGLEQQVERLLLFSPRDHRDEPILSHWKDIPGLILQESRSHIRDGVITLEEIRDSQLDVVNRDGFPGLTEFMQEVERKVIIDAAQKLEKNQDMARALKVSPGRMSIRRRRAFLAPDEFDAATDREFQNHAERSV